MLLLSSLFHHHIQHIYIYNIQVPLIINVFIPHCRSLSASHTNVYHYLLYHYHSPVIIIINIQIVVLSVCHNLKLAALLVSGIYITWAYLFISHSEPYATNASSQPQSAFRRTRLRNRARPHIAGRPRRPTRSLRRRRRAHAPRRMDAPPHSRQAVPAIRRRRPRLVGRADAHAPRPRPSRVREVVHVRGAHGYGQGPAAVPR